MTMFLLSYDDIKLVLLGIGAPFCIGQLMAGRFHSLGYWS